MNPPRLFGFPLLILLTLTPAISCAQIKGETGTDATAWSVAVLDRILSSTDPGQKLASVGDMRIPVTNLRVWRNQLAGVPMQESAFDGTIQTWTGGNVYYEFTTSGSNAVSVAKQRACVDAMTEWTTFANLHFIAHTSQSNYVTIFESPFLAGGQSDVGMVGGQQFLQIGPSAWNRGTLVHELGHTLGLIHEHQRSDRDSFVIILTNNISAGEEANFIKLSNSQNHGQYDFLSVMHYSRIEFSVDTNTLDTIEPLPAFSQFLNILGQGDPVLTPLDRAGMANVYGAGPAQSSVVTNTSDSGAGSLRAAVYYGFDHPGTTVTFNIATNDPGFTNNVFLIQLTDQLPSLINATTIDGSTETVHSNPAGPSVAIDGSLVPTPSAFPNGMHFRGANCAVRSLAINNFPDSCVLIDGANATGNVVSGCYLGIDPTGNVAGTNGNAVLIIASGASGNTIGGNTAAARNVISGSPFQGVVITDSGTKSNVVAGNYLGLNGAGNAAISNTWSGVAIFGGAQSNIIGGTLPSLRNVIAGNGLQGVTLSGTNTTGNIVEGNFIGLAPSGTNAIPNGWAGVDLFDSAQDNLIGGTTTGARNIISGNSHQGVAISQAGTGGNLVQGNYIGLDPSGTTAIPNILAGVDMFGATQGNTIGGTAAGALNVISGNTLQGVNLSQPGTGNNLVQGNLIGLNATGTASVPNGGAGVDLSGTTQGNLIGGAIPAARNFISGNTGQGIAISDAGTSNNFVQGNYIGLDITGTLAVSNNAGVDIFGGTQNNIIGGAVPGAGNVISGNAGGGLFISQAGTGKIIVQGNLIGLNAAGTAAVPNTGAGIALLNSAQSNLIGGVTAAARNVVSGNADRGILIINPDTTANTVIGNYVGLNAAGAAAIPNTLAGVELFDGSHNNVIGGSGGARNFISGNGIDGVEISGVGTDANIVQGNTIGLDASGTVAVPNAVAGIEVFGGSVSNQLGGTNTGMANTIAHNPAGGIRLFDSTTLATSIRGNSIFANAGGGIDLFTGANNSATAPILSSAVLTTNTTVAGTLSSSPGTAFLLDFYASPPPLNQAQGQTWLGAGNVTTSAGGTVGFSAHIRAPVPIGQIITATATDPSGNTSAFSAGVAVTAVDSVGDGIPDAWRAAHFGGSGTTTNSLSCAACDADHDGMSNLREFLAGTDPNNAASALRLGMLTLTVTNATVNFSSVTGIVYRVESRDDLATGFWSVIADQIMGTGGTMQIVDPGAGASLPRRFYRLSVSP